MDACSHHIQHVRKSLQQLCPAELVTTMGNIMMCRKHSKETSRPCRREPNLIHQGLCVRMHGSLSPSLKPPSCHLHHNNADGCLPIILVWLEPVIAVSSIPQKFIKKYSCSPHHLHWRLLYTACDGDPFGVAVDHRIRGRLFARCPSRLPAIITHCIKLGARGAHHIRILVLSRCFIYCCAGCGYAGIYI